MILYESTFEICFVGHEKFFLDHHVRIQNIIIIENLKNSIPDLESMVA